MYVNPSVGSASQKIDIFKITCKALLCIGVGLIKKTLVWYQILCIPYSTNLKILHVSQPDGLRALPIITFGTQALGLGVNILQYILQFCRAPGHKLLKSSSISKKLHY